MTVTVSVLADRPDLLEPVWNMHSSWPTFMTEDPIGSMYFDPAIFELFADHVLVCQDEVGEVIGRAVSIPFHVPDAAALPEDGWDGAIRRGIRGRLIGQTANVVSALEISLTPKSQGRRLSTTLLVALRDNARRLGFSELVAPLRPNGRTDFDEPFASYVHRTRPDGLPVDPWLRVHVRAGGRIGSVAPRSMVVPGTLDQWRVWTGLPFDRSGPVHVPGALVPVIADVEQGTAVYTEPNVWVRHTTDPRCQPQ
ncbi:N-acetyltransferase [Rhodococcus fascians]|nr:N-acetyltransferase [Rhodococcus fascians]